MGFTLDRGGGALRHEPGRLKIKGRRRCQVNADAEEAGIAILASDRPDLGAESQLQSTGQSSLMETETRRG